MDRPRLVLVLVAAHLVLTALHGLVHVSIPLFPPFRTTAVAVGVLYLLPILGGVLVLWDRRWAGAIVFVAAGIGSLVFEGTFHFLLRNPDHVAHVTEHRGPFLATALLTTVGDLLLVVAAWVAIGGATNPRVEHPADGG